MDGWGSVEGQDVDPEVAEIVAAHQAGTEDLLAAYEQVERHYMVAAQVTQPTMTYSANTSSAST